VFLGFIISTFLREDLFGEQFHDIPNGCSSRLLVQTGPKRGHRKVLGGQEGLLDKIIGQREPGRWLWKATVRVRKNRINQHHKLERSSSSTFHMDLDTFSF
jgi:hypothetical protein